MVNIADVTVLNDLIAKLKEITPEQIEGISRKLNKEVGEVRAGETVIGTIELETTRALYALARMLHAQEGMEDAKADAAMDETSEADHRSRAAVYDMFEDIARQLFWVQAKMDLGFQVKESVGIRADWTLVKTADQEMPDGLNLGALLRRIR